MASGRMRQITLHDAGELGDLLYTIVKKLNLSACAVVFSKEARTLLSYFTTMQDVLPELIAFYPVDAYSEEYYVTLYNDKCLTIVPARQTDENRHFLREDESDVLLIDGAVSSGVIEANDGKTMLEVDFEDDADITCSTSESKSYKLKTEFPFTALPSKFSIVDNIDYINYYNPITWD